VRGGCCIPRKGRGCETRAFARPLQRVAVVEEPAGGRREAVAVVGGDDGPCRESPHRLGNPADVVGDGRHACAERPEERAALVELLAVREERNRRLGERVVDLGFARVVRSPFDPWLAAPCRDVDERLSDDEEPRVEPAGGGDGVLELLVRPDHPEEEERAAVVLVALGAREDRVRDDPDARSIHPDLRHETLPPALAVGDDAIEAAVEPAPEVALRRGPSRQNVVGGDDGRPPPRQEARVELRERRPLEVKDVPFDPAEATEADSVLTGLQRQAERRAAEEARAPRIEELPPAVAVGQWGRAEPKRGRDQFDLRAGPRESRRERVVVRQRERGRVDERNTHDPYTSSALELLIRTWNLFHGRSYPPTRHLYLEQAVRLAVADAPDLVAFQEVPLWALGRLADWSGMRVMTARAKPALLGRLAEPLHRLEARFVRSALTGQANALLVGPRLEVEAVRVVVLTENEGRERRVCQLAELRAPGTIFTAANLHASGARHNARAELALVEERVAGTSRAVVCGDFNVPALGLPGFSSPLPGIDQVLVRGLALLRPAVRWAEERRRHGNVILSDHAPVDAVAGLPAA
jgi:endonuclease/exonuclease/phosphatase family metal-dependent hydrolase